MTFLVGSSSRIMTSVTKLYVKDVVRSAMRSDVKPIIGKRDIPVVSGQAKLKEVYLI